MSLFSPHQTLEGSRCEGLAEHRLHKCVGHHKRLHVGALSSEPLVFYHFKFPCLTNGVLLPVNISLLYNYESFLLSFSKMPLLEIKHIKCHFRIEQYVWKWKCLMFVFFCLSVFY